MCQKNSLEAFPEKFPEKLRRGRIGQVAVIAANTLFQMPGIGAVAQHFLIVVGLENQHPAPLETLYHETGA